MKRLFILSALSAAMLAMFFQARAQQTVTDVVLAPKPKQLTKYVAPHKPITRIKNVKKANEGKPNWTELVVNDDHLHSEYIQSAPGTKVSKRLHPDTRTWMVVMEGEIAFDIEGTKPFTAKKGWMVDVPLQTWYSMETVGSTPSLRFETNIAGAKTLYPTQADTPQMPGIDFIPVRFARRPSVWDNGNAPYKTFDELAAKVEKGGAQTTQRVIHDDRAVANFIYGYAKNLPALNPKEKGHYHPECAEFWLIMAGQIRYPIEGQPEPIIADVGDVVYAPKFTFHAPRFWGEGPSCRLAMNGYPNIAHLFEAH